MHVHRVGRLAAERTGVRVLEATMPRELLGRVNAVARRLRVPGLYDDADPTALYLPSAQITHRIDVRRFARQKRAALRAHRSQAALFGPVPRIPVPLFGALFGREWFRDPNDGTRRRDIWQ